VHGRHTVSADTLIPLLFGNAYTDAVPLTKILVWQAIWIPYLWLPGLLLALGRPRLVTTLAAVDAAGYVVLLLLAAPAFGVTGIAWAMVLRFAVWVAMASTIDRRLTLLPKGGVS
jgi:O-antigen/teichoic acid export membrane protein